MSWDKRVREEKRELNDRLERLERFLDTPSMHGDISLTQLRLLRLQRDVMQSYNHILFLRLNEHNETL